MNPNMGYGPSGPMQPGQRRHDGSFVPMPQHMRPHQGYQPYYPHQMTQMLPQYPQHYPPQWYPYQQPHIHPHHAARPQYYQHPPPPLQQPYSAHHGPLVVSSQPHPQPSPRPAHIPPPAVLQQNHSTSSVTSVAPVQAPPSPPLSSTSTNNAKKDVVSPMPSPAPQVEPDVITEPIPQPSPPREPFFPPVPWLSFEEGDFPPRAHRRRRKVVKSALSSEPITFPLLQSDPESQEKAADEMSTPVAGPAEIQDGIKPDTNEVDLIEQTAPTPVQTPTPLTSDAPSDAVSTQPTTPSSAVPAISVAPQKTPTQPKAARAVGPVIPAVPVLPHGSKKNHRDSVVSAKSKESEVTPETRRVSDTPSVVAAEEEQTSVPTEEVKPASVPPKSWADLVRSKAGAQNIVSTASAPTINITASNGLGIARTEVLSEVLMDMPSAIENPDKLAFLQPRGLVNTGNMCYMNSVLQLLVFCIPLYDFLDKVAKRSKHAFQSDTPLLDAMIMFIREYAVIDSAVSLEQLRLRLKPEDYEKYGDSFIPEYVYTVIKQLPRFRDMRRGHQQDAQEFLGFLLEELHEECARALRTGTSTASGMTTPVGSAISEAGDNEAGWMEVGHKQKAAVTRSSGTTSGDSPVSSIFGGKLRSELKIAGNKMSVTLEPYQSLQLDIGSDHVNNIVDALKGLTKPESMQGDFFSQRGQKATATKQVFIETLPPVLILHLKRFHYDNTTNRAEKIWKHIGYPLELEIPKDVFPTQTRNKVAAQGGLPKYRLTGVIYHHGRYANGGHYTVDIRRQDEREWIRIDDTVIRRIRSEDVAEGGSATDPKVLVKALESHEQGKASNNIFDQIEQEEEDGDSDKAWSHVNGHSRSKSTMSTAVNGAVTPAKEANSGFHTPSQKYSVKDNKVAYLLFYQRF